MRCKKLCSCAAGPAVMQTIDVVKHVVDFRQMMRTFMLNVGVLLLLYVTYNRCII